MLTEEIWKDVEGYEKLYQVSNLGRVRSLGRDIIRNTRWGTSKPYHIAGKVLKILRAQADYRYVHLFDEQGTPTNKKVHRLVAQAFVQNPRRLEEVNHIDEDKGNNRADNLEWVTHTENCNHGTRNERTIAKTSKGVEQLTADGHHITFYPSQIEAERQTGIHRSQIRACCQGKPRYQTAGGFRWRYKVITTDNGKS